MTMKMGYALSSIILVALLVAILALWKWKLGSLDVDQIKSRQAECFYWVTILFSNTLGTALGDFLSDNSGLGFMGGACLVGALLVAVISFYFFTSVSRVALFWLAFVLTRPFGATLGDVLTKSREDGGLALGTIGSSSVLGCALILLVAYTLHREKKPRSES